MSKSLEVFAGNENAHTREVFIRKDGNMRIVFHPNQRKSISKFVVMDVTADQPGYRVEPARLLPRIAFLILRRLFGRAGKVAQWTRTWRCWWQLKNQDGSPIREFRLTRSHNQAVAWEITRLGRQFSEV